MIFLYLFDYFRLATIYTAVNGDIKRVILRVLEIPVSFCLILLINYLVI